MARNQSSDNGGTPAPISGHRLFPAIGAVLGAALLGIGCIMVPGSLLDRLVAASGIAGVMPAAAPPLGESARLLIAGVAALMGGRLGLGLARTVAVAQFNARPTSSDRMARIKGIRAAVAPEPAPEPAHKPVPEPQHEPHFEREAIAWDDPTPDRPTPDRDEEWSAEAAFDPPPALRTGWEEAPPPPAEPMAFAPPEKDHPVSAPETQQHSAPPLGQLDPGSLQAGLSSAFRAPRLPAAAVEPGLMSRLQALQTANPAPRPLAPALGPLPDLAEAAAESSPAPFEPELDHELAAKPFDDESQEDWAKGWGEDSEFGEQGDAPIIDAMLGAFRDYARDYAGGDDGDEEEEEEEEEEDDEEVGGTAQSYGSLLGMTVRRRAADEPIELVGFDGETMSDAEADLALLEEVSINQDFTSPLVVRRRIDAAG